jgi:hypothetical protein
LLLVDRRMPQSNFRGRKNRQWSLLGAKLKEVAVTAHDLLVLASVADRNDTVCDPKHNLARCGSQTSDGMAVGIRPTVHMAVRVRSVFNMAVGVRSAFYTAPGIRSAVHMTAGIRPTVHMTDGRLTADR